MFPLRNTLRVKNIISHYSPEKVADCTLAWAEEFDKEFFDIIKDINKDGTTILLVEQNAGKSLAISDRAYVRETGSIVLSGTGEELASSEEVKKAYLGV